MTAIRDAQRQKVYDWENEYVIGKDKSHVPFEQIQTIVNFVWGSEGLQHPPRVEELPKQCRVVGATGSRLKLRVPLTGLSTTVILHELAHSMTSTHEGKSAHHGPRFVGVYMDLLTKYAGHDREALQRSATERGVRFNGKGKTV